MNSQPNKATTPEYEPGGVFYALLEARGISVDRAAPARSEAELATMLAGKKREFESQDAERKSLRCPLDAMMLLSLFAAEQGLSDPDTAVSVPLWAIRAIGDTWGGYWYGNDRTTLGRAFGVEGAGQGSSPQRSTDVTLWRDRMLALDIATLEAVGPDFTGSPERPEKLDWAKAEIKQRSCLSEDTIKKVWQRHGEDARAAVRDVLRPARGTNLVEVYTPSCQCASSSEVLYGRLSSTQKER